MGDFEINSVSWNLSKIRAKLPNQWVTRTFTEVKGRKDYTCSVCKKHIPKGTVHYTYATFTDIGNERVHINCIES